MEEIKSYVKSKIASFPERIVETVMFIKLFQGWRKKRRRDDDDAVSSSTKSNEKDKIGSLLSSEVESKRRRTEVIIGTILNDDVLEEVMYRLPAKALSRFQLVSPHWRVMIKSKTFKDRYMLRHKTQEPKFLCLYDDDESKNLTLKVMRLKCNSSTCLIEESPGHQIEQGSKEDVRVSGSCDGLVCIFDAKSFTTPIILTNPAMGRSQTLPLSLLQQQYKDKEKPAPKGFCFPGFGRDNITGTYKLIWLHKTIRNNELSSSCEIFDFEAKEWRYVIDLTCMISRHQLPTFANGWVYWFTDEKKMLACNLHTEMFRLITIEGIVFQTLSLDTMDMFSVNDSLWITHVKEENGMQHFWNIENIVKSEVEWHVKKTFSINSSFLSRWIHTKRGSSSPWPFVRLIATPKDNKEALVSVLCYSNILQLLPRFHSSVFQSLFSVPYSSDFIPYFQSLHFPL